MEEENSKENKVNYSQEQVQDILFKGEISWKEIIFDLINTEQLDPWDIDISVLTDRFLEKIEEYENLDFFISSQVLLAASLLLRIKSELLLSKYMRGIDEILFGEEKDSKKRLFERIELDEDIPELIPKSPMPRYRRVTLNELIESLNKAIITENRRIKKTIVNQNALRETGISLPKRKFNIANKLKSIHGRLIAHFDANKSHKKIPYSSFIGNEKEERALSFYPLLQLEMNDKIWLEQESSFDEIHIWMKKVYLKYNPHLFDDLIDSTSELSIEELKRLEEVEKFDDLIDEE
ncbi:segregation/condensation protein A [archaeon]|nr:segregation/condensation protein A [archaeon]